MRYFGMILKPGGWLIAETTRFRITYLGCPEIPGSMTEVKTYISTDAAAASYGCEPDEAVRQFTGGTPVLRCSTQRVPRAGWWIWIYRRGRGKNNGGGVNLGRSI